MSLAYKILGQKYFTAASILSNSGYGYGYTSTDTPTDWSETLYAQLLYTVPANTQTTITSIIATNADTVSRTYDLAIVPAKETLALKHHIRWNQPVASNDFELVSSKITMGAGDKIYVFPSTINNFGFTAFGVEIS